MNDIKETREDCQFFKDGKCTKGSCLRACSPSSREWLTDRFGQMDHVDRMCQESSDYGNRYYAITDEDIQHLITGGILNASVGGEYMVFIGFRNAPFITREERREEISLWPEN